MTKGWLAEAFLYLVLFIGKDQDEIALFYLVFTVLVQYSPLAFDDIVQVFEGMGVMGCMAAGLKGKYAGRKGSVSRPLSIS